MAWFVADTALTERLASLGLMRPSIIAYGFPIGDGSGAERFLAKAFPGISGEDSDEYLPEILALQQLALEECRGTQSSIGSLPSWELSAAVEVRKRKREEEENEKKFAKARLEQVRERMPPLAGVRRSTGTKRSHDFEGDPNGRANAEDEERQK